MKIQPFNDISAKLLDEDRKLLSNTQFPIVTISASYRDELEKVHDIYDNLEHQEVVFSRAHYSMALAVAMGAWKDLRNEKKAWMVDPSNYVTKKALSKLITSEIAGRLMARYSILHWVKENLVDRYGRGKLPITDAVTPPLLYLTQTTTKPIISMHILAGNTLAPLGKKVVQVVTDPHVRTDYVTYANLPNMRFCVFDDATKANFIEVALSEGKVVDPDHVIVTGPPIDPRVLEAKEKKTPESWRRRPLRLLLTTGGLGTNKEELEVLLEGLMAGINRRSKKIQILYYAGTNQDHVKMVKRIAKKHRVAIGKNDDTLSRLRILSAQDVVVANELLVTYAFPWADIVYTKPSGDMAYDAVGAGCALLLLKPWGEWERNIQFIFQRLELAQNAQIENPLLQLDTITNGKEAWLAKALHKTRLMPPKFSRGVYNILAVAKNWM